jgi:MFS family permease
MVRRAILASMVGSGLEWFDFLAYAYFSKTIASVFFPSANSFVSLMLTFATFAVGFIVRPLGGVLFGLYADRAGRRNALSLLIVCMAASTLLMGLVPGYARIGLAAPLLVVLARLLQGLSVGGQFGTTAALLVEYAPATRKMFYGSFSMSAQALAILLSAGCGFLLTTHLTHDELTTWGWRVPFFVGALAAPIGLYIRHRVAESPEFAQLQDKHETTARVSTGQFFRENGTAALCAMGVVIVGTASTYVWHSYMSVYVERQLHLPLSDALLGTFVSGVVTLFLYPVAGRIADRIGAYRMFYPVVIVWIVCAYPLFHFVVSAPSEGRLFAAQMVATVFLAAMSGPHPGMLAMLFPVRYRSAGVALSYNIAVTLFGGMAAMTVTGLTHMTGSSMTPAFYLIASGVISLGLVFYCRAAGAARGSKR